MKLAIGIDTGGTYTDAVLYDFETKKILGTAKALTTKNDLCVGIGNALDALPNEHFREVRMLSLSTTLATNACVEGKGGAAKLVFFNGDKDILQKYGGEYGLPPVGEILVEPCRTDISGQIEEYPDWEKFERDVRENCRNADGIGVIELYSFKNGAVIEREAKERIAKIADIPVTCGYELFREPNSLQRGAGTLLNAGLYPVIEDFLRAVRRAMRARGIDAPAVIMRSDGSLMSEEFARKHPVETLLCGPAASVAGGCALSREKNAVIVDMGGTTTDIAIVQGGLPVRANDGVTVGKWRTYVEACSSALSGWAATAPCITAAKNLFWRSTASCRCAPPRRAIPPCGSGFPASPRAARACIRSSASSSTCSRASRVRSNATQRGSKSSSPRLRAARSF